METEDYHAEDDGVEDEPDEVEDWLSKGVWCNYRSCILSSSAWGDGGILIGTPGNRFDFERAFPAVLHVDPLLPDEIPDFEDLAFPIYLLGYDACAGHHIEITDARGHNFKINWTGKIALAYAGETEFRYDFDAHIDLVPFDGIYYPKEWSQETALEQLAQLVTDPEKFIFEDLNPKSFQRVYKLIRKP